MIQAVVFLTCNITTAAAASATLCLKCGRECKQIAL